MKTLPVGEQVFEKIRESGFLYVDKTRYIHEILQMGTYFFLSRPRRFGKTLLIDTMKTLFEGRRDLFKGLWIEDHYDWSQTYPVVHISFNHAHFREMPLPQALAFILKREAKRYGLSLHEQTPGAQLEELITRLAEGGQKVALLIDEYDKTMTDYLDDLPQARANRDVLKAFYSPLKALDANLHMVFVTGVSKYGKVSIFSDLNNLNDLTLAKPMATLLGYTQEELESNMAEHMAATAHELEMPPEAFKAQLKHFYNGYSWDGKTAVYNPFSINKFFFDREFMGHWFNTGTPTMLVKMLAQQSTPPYQLEETWGSENLMNKLGLEAPPHELTALLWQTGYLTIKKVSRVGGRLRYLLGFPNQEVRDAFLLHIWYDYAVQTNDQAPDSRLEYLTQALLEDRLEDFFAHFQSLMASIPHQLFLKQEAYYHTLVYLVAELCGLKPQSERSVSGGAMDMVLQSEACTYIFEFKLTTPQEALDQIKAKGYHHPYLHQGKKVRLVGVAFDAATRSLSAWQEEEA